RALLHSSSLLSFRLTRRPPRPPLLPYTTLFRSPSWLRPGQVPHLGRLAQQVEHPLAGCRGLGQPPRVLGKILHRPEGVPQVGHEDRKSTRLNSVTDQSRMPSSA